jgi:hypothetical protein
MKVLIGCEFSGIVQEAFKAKGHDAWSCDLEPIEIPGNHIQDDILNHLDEGWDLAIFHPPCTDKACSGARWFKQKREDGRQQAGIDFFMKLANADIPKIAIENPVGIMSSIFRTPDQIIQPWMFGEPFQKSTCLWLKNLPLLVPTNIVDKGEFITYASGKKMPKWYADAWKLSKTERAKLRNRTFKGIAKAFASQWSGE